MKDKIIAELTSACEDLFGTKIVAVHGTAMVLLGIRESTQDIDAFGDFQLDSFIPSGIETNYGPVYNFSNMELSSVPLNDPRYEGLIKITDTVYCSSPEQIIADKLKIGRDKDLRAIEEIQLWSRNAGIC